MCEFEFFTVGLPKRTGFTQYQIWQNTTNRCGEPTPDEGNTDGQDSRETIDYAESRARSIALSLI